MHFSHTKLVSIIPHKGRRGRCVYEIVAREYEPLLMGYEQPLVSSENHEGCMTAFTPCQRLLILLSFVVFVSAPCGSS